VLLSSKRRLRWEVRGADDIASWRLDTVYQLIFDTITGQVGV